MKLLISDLIIGYPWWFLLLVLLIGLLYAGLLYVGNRKNKPGKAWISVLFVLRFIAVSTLAFLLLSPFIKTKKRNTEAPIIVFGTDNSRSVVLGKDSSFYRTDFISSVNKQKESLSTEYDIDTYLFGTDIIRADNPDFSFETSNYSAFIRRIDEEYTGLNIGALILAGDGIHNQGIDPVFAASSTNFPIYTIALGDTILNKDLKVNDVRYNSLVYLGDDFPIEVNVTANSMADSRGTIRVYAFGKTIKSLPFDISGERFSKNFKFIIPAETKGKQRIRIVVESDVKEISSENNIRNIFVDVLDSRQKILVLANAPHPDLSAIRQSLATNRNHEIEIAFPQSFKGDLNDFDMIILHQVPSHTQQAMAMLNDINQKQIPTLFILGKQSDLNAFNRYFQGINLRITGRVFEEAQLEFNPSFSLFSFPTDYAEQLENLPPLIVPFGNYQLSNSTSVFGNQKINNMITDFPLVVFSEENGRKSGLIAGEGLWMWKMHNYLQMGNTDAFDELIGKTVQLLLARKDKRFFRVNTKGEYNSSENIIVKAELYNQSYEPVNSEDVNFKLTNEEGEQFNYLFSPLENIYTLDLKRLPVGVHKYRATVQLGGEKYAANGEFIVSGELLESRNLNADHAMLFRLANDHDGKMIYPNEITSISDILSQRDDLKSKIYYEEKYSGLNTMPYVIGLILLLLSLEWFLRKYLGGY